MKVQSFSDYSSTKETISEVDGELIVEGAGGARNDTIYMTSKKDTKHVKDLSKVIDKFMVMYEKEMSLCFENGGHVHPKILGRVRYTSSAGKISEASIYTYSKDDIAKIEQNKIEGKSSNKKNTRNAHSFKVGLGVGEFRTLNLDNVLAIVMDGFLYVPEGSEQQKDILKYIEEVANKKVKATDMTIAILEALGFGPGDKFPKVRTIEEQKQRILDAIVKHRGEVSQSKKQIIKDDIERQNQGIKKSDAMLYKIDIDSYNGKVATMKVQINKEAVIKKLFNFTKLTKSKPAPEFTGDKKAWASTYTDCVKTIEDILNPIAKKNKSSYKLATAYINFSL